MIIWDLPETSILFSLKSTWRREELPRRGFAALLCVHEVEQPEGKWRNIFQSGSWTIWQRRATVSLAGIIAVDNSSDEVRMYLTRVGPILRDSSIIRLTNSTSPPVVINSLFAAVQTYQRRGISSVWSSKKRERRLEGLLTAKGSSSFCRADSSISSIEV